MLSKRKVAVIVIALCIFGISCVMFTIALLTDRQGAMNTFEFGVVEVTLTESVNQSQELRLDSFVSRRPVVNSTEVDCFVRAIVTISDMDNNQSIMDFIELSDLGDGWYVSDSSADGIWNETNKVIVYYDKPIGNGSLTATKTEPIFDGFTIHSVNGAGEALTQGMNNTFNIDIAVEAVQANIGGSYFANPEDAFEQMDIIPAAR